jgi:hypothetical protein
MSEEDQTYLLPVSEGFVLALRTAFPLIRLSLAGQMIPLGASGACPVVTDLDEGKVRRDDHIVG